MDTEGEVALARRAQRRGRGHGGSEGSEQWKDKRIDFADLSTVDFVDFSHVSFADFSHVDFVDFSLARQISSKLDLLSLNRKVRQ